MHLKQPRFTSSTCGPFTKNKERIQKIKETGNTKYICRNQLDKACFQHDMAYGYFNIYQKEQLLSFLRDKVFRIVKNPKYDRYQRYLASMVHKFFDKKSAGSGVTTLVNKSASNNEIKQSLQLPEELHKPIVRNF